MELTALQQLVHQMYIAYYQRPADPDGLQYWVDQLEQNGDWTAVSAAFGAPENEENQALYGDLNREQTIAAIYQSAFNREAVAEEVAFWAASEFSATDLTFAIVNGAQNSDKATVDNKVAFSAELVAQVGTNAAYAELQDPKALLTAVTEETEVTAGYVSDAVASGKVGETFSLTADDAGKNIVLTANNDTVEANSAALAGTNIIDQGGRDTLNATLTQNLTNTTTIEGVEKVNFNWDAFGTATVDATNIKGVTGGSDITVSSSKTGFLGDVTINSTGANNVTAGTGAVGTLTLNGVTGSTVTGGAAKTVTVNGTAATTDTATVTGGASTTSITTTATENVTVNAGAATTTVSVSDYNVATVDAGKATSITLSGASATSSATVSVGGNTSVTNGAGKLSLGVVEGATVTLDDIGEDLTVTGTGDATLKMTSAGLNNETIVNSRTDGKLTIDVTSAVATLDVTKAQADIIKLGVAGTTVVTTNTGRTFQVDADLGTGGFTVGGTATTDTINTTFTKSQGTSTTFTGIETVNIVAAAAQATGAATNTDLTFNSLVASGNKINLSGTNDVAVTSLNAKSLDASGLNGLLTVTTATTTDVSISGSQGKNDVTFDTTAAGSKATFVGQSADDTVKFGTLAADAQATAVTGAGNDSITADVTTLNGGSLVVESGAGNDTVTLTGDADTKGNIVLQFGEGNDTLKVAATTNFTGANLTVGGMEKLDVGAHTVTVNASQFAQFGAFELAGATNGSLVVDASASTDAVTINGANASLNFGTAAKFSVIGGSGNDTITGTIGADTLNGGGNVAVTAVSEVQTLDVTGTATGQVTFLGHNVATSASSDTAELTIDKIVADSANVIATWNAANPTREINSITKVDADTLQITYANTEGDVANLNTASSAGIDFAASTETTKGVEAVAAAAFSADTFTGGAGADTFVIGTAGAATASVADVITDFVSGTDKIDFQAFDIAGTNTNYQEATAAVADFAAAKTAADAVFNADTTVLYSAQQVGADTYVFAAAGASTAAEHVVKLTGVALSGIEFGDIAA